MGRGTEGGGRWRPRETAQKENQTKLTKTGKSAKEDC